MRVSDLHPWSLSPVEAMALQSELRVRLEYRALDWSQLRVVAGVDVSYGRRHYVVPAPLVHAAISVFSFPELRLLEESIASVPATFPYVPGLLTFREGPAVVEAARRLNLEPDAFIYDGHGVAHPRGFGIASHFGLLLGKPTVGCAKSCLFGKYEGPGPLRGSSAPLTDGERVIGAVLRTRDRVAPVFVSVGNAIDLEGAVRLVLECSARYRLPEPTRRAHELAGQARRAAEP